MSVKREIPNHWKVKTLGEIGEIVSGGTPSTSVAAYWNGNISWISPSDLTGYHDKVIFHGKKSISESGLKNSSARLIPKGSVLFSSRAPIGYVVIAGNNVSTNQGFKSVVPYESICNEYLYYFLKASKQEAEKAANGTTFKEISLKAFSKLAIPLPPPKEQQAIVSKIEELLSDLENGKQQLLLAQQQLKIYRQSLLKWAFEGKLTNKEVKDGKLPNGWRVRKLGEVCTTTSGGTPSRGIKSYYEGNIPWVKSGELDKGLITVTEEKISEEAVKNSSAKIFPKGTLLIALYGATIGKLAFLGVEAATNQAVCGIYQNENINSNFLYYYLVFKKPSLVKQGIGGAQPNISQGILKNLEIPVMTFEEQRFIVEELESKLTVCDKIEETICQSLLQTESLRQSILKKAFEGKLV